jgi:hypothetical protein
MILFRLAKEFSEEANNGLAVHLEKVRYSKPSIEEFKIFSDDKESSWRKKEICLVFSLI